MAQDQSNTSREVAERAANVLAPESSLFENLDAAGFGGALAQVLRSGMTHPLVPGQGALRLASDLARVPFVTAAARLGRPGEPPVPLDAQDPPVADPARTRNPPVLRGRPSYPA